MEIIGPEIWGRFFMRKSLRRSGKCINFALRNEENYLMTGKMKLYKCQFEPTERWLGRNCKETIDYICLESPVDDYDAEELEEAYHALCPNCQRIIKTVDDLVTYKKTRAPKK